MYTRALYTKNGDVITLTDSEAEGIKNALRSGEKWVIVQGEMLSADTIARVGNHEMSAEVKRIQSADLERSLLLSGKSEEVEKIRELKKRVAIRSHREREEVLLEERRGRGMSDAEEERGESMFYIGEGGEKMFS